MLIGSIGSSGSIGSVEPVIGAGAVLPFRAAPEPIEPPRSDHSARTDSANKKAADIPHYARV
jgi:hypothetical protein